MKTAYQILIVEDNDIAQRMTSMMFKQQGAEVWVAPTAKEALLLTNTQRFSLIIMDVGLPDGCGIEISQHIRNNPDSPNQQTPIIVVTAHYDNHENRQHCQAIGINEVIQKPLLSKNIEMLMATLEPYGHLPIYDEQKAITLHRDKATASKTLKLYINELAHMLPSFDQYYYAQDWKRLKAAVHREHGAGIYCGTTKLNAILNDMETLLRESPPNPTQISCHYQQVKTAIQQLIELSQQ